MKKLWYLPLLFGLLLTACSGPGGNNPPPTSGKGVINGLVTDSGTGARLAGVTVSAAGKSVQTNETGQFSLSGLPEGTVKLSFELSDYAPGFANAEVGDQATPVLVTLKRQGDLQDYDATQSATIYQTTEAGPYAVIFSPNSLNTTDTSLRVSVTPLDPTKESSALPGELVTSNAILSPLTFAEFSIFDSEGNRVNLKAGASAEVELPIPVELRSRYTLGQVIHCYSYNPETGQWEDFVDGKVQLSSIDGTTPVIRARIKHFSWYGAAPESNDCIEVYVKVVSAVDGTPLSGARVEAFPGTVATTDADGFAHIVTVPGGPSHYTASKTYIDTDGSVSGIPGAKVIEFGEVDIELFGLVTVPCNSVATQGLTPAAGEQSDPLEIAIGYVGQVSYFANAILDAASTGTVSVSLSEMDPEGNLGDWVSGARVVLGGPDGSVPLDELQPGLYYATADLTPGARYTLSIDADGNGAIDGTGAVYAVGDIAWINPLDGSTQNAAGLTAEWSDSGVGVDPAYSAVYYVTLSRVTDSTEPIENVDFATYIGSNRQFAANSTLYGDPANPVALKAGPYVGSIFGFSGPFLAAGGSYTPTNNISGANMSGQFYSWSSTSSTDIDFTLQ